MDLLNNSAEVVELTSSDCQIEAVNSTICPYAYSLKNATS
jgi:hypothetical protein